MKRFNLVRSKDLTGISGTGTVGHGVEFTDTDGSCVMRWDTPTSSTTFYRSIEDLVHIHGHEGATVVEWID